MRKMLYVQYATMLIICFISGVACYQLFDLQQAIQIIELGDSRLVTLEKPTILLSALPLVLAIGIVLFFSTHSFLAFCAQIFVAIKLTFLGFSSVFLLVQHNSIKLYGLWWFPFQLIYCILLLVLYSSVNRKHVGKAARSVYSIKQVFPILFIMCIIFILEMVAISYVFK